MILEAISSANGTTIGHFYSHSLMSPCLTFNHNLSVKASH
jgi:hypothetical protein